MRSRRAVAAITFATCVAGCASGKLPGAQNDAATGVDASERPDSPRAIPDGPVADARPDSALPPDAPDAPPPDAPPPPPDSCVPTVNEKLVNPSFDSTPPGTGWTETRLHPSLAIITDEGIEHAGPYAAYLGGVSGEQFDPPRAQITDILDQRFTLPADTTAVVLTGYYYVSTEEGFFPGIYDRASVSLVDGNTDALIETALSVNDDQATPAYTSFTKTFNAANLAGRTVKLRLTSSHDDTYVTHFLFDTFSITATHCP